jgi:hypothetical protein
MNLCLFAVILNFFLCFNVPQNVCVVDIKLAAAAVPDLEVVAHSEVSI